VDEGTWLNERHHPQAMVWVLRGTKVTRTKAGKRKLRLFACACCRLTWGLLTDPLLRQAVEVAERFAEGQASKDELERAYESARGLGMGAYTPDAPDHRERTAASMAVQAAHPKAFSAAFAMTAYPVSLAGSYGGSEQERDAVLCGLLRCVFGNPFRPSPPLPPAVLTWNDRTVPRLAEAIYNDRLLPEGTLDPSRLAILADALLDAGAEDDSLLEHLRSPGPHVRGCFAVNILLGRS
jgi:hypothetical protein